MNNLNPDVTKYIETAAEFARPIMLHLRELMHATCPNVVEKMKWSHPHFDYKGKGMSFMQALKERVTFGFWDDSLIFDPKKLSVAAIAAREGMGFMKTLQDMPSDQILIDCIKVAMDAKDRGLKVVKIAKPKKELVIPDYFLAALAKNKKAQEGFDALSPSHKREYVDWIVDAKTEETREKRMAQALEQIAEGKSKHWKYQ